MIQNTSTKSSVRRLGWIFALTYMFSYITRTNLGAIVAEMEHATGFSRELLSMSLTGSFISYGAGQIVSGICGDRFSPKKLVSFGFLLTVTMNLLLPFCRNPYQMAAVWSINGFAQAFMWPPIVRLMVMLLPQEDYSPTVVKVSWGGSAGTIAVYLLSPLLITLLGWRSIFWCCALLGFAWIFVWNRCVPEVQIENKQAVARSPVCMKGLFTPLMLGIMVAIVMQGMLRDGITTWMPSYISETYQLSNVVAILSGVILPIFSILCTRLSDLVYRKWIPNPITCGGVLFGVGMAASGLLYFLSDRSAVVSVLLAAIITATMHGVNIMLVSIVPASFQKYGNTATASGVLNACTYVGSALSTYGIAVLSQRMGWSGTILIWCFIALVGAILCLLAIRPWKKEHT